MLHFLKISFNQIFLSSAKSNNRFVIFFGIASLTVCASTLCLAICLSQGFADKVSLKLSSIDGHYRITSLYPEYSNKLNLNLLNDLKGVIENDSLFLSYSGGISAPVSG